MILASRAVHLIDVNVAIALLDEDHLHHALVEEWFDTPGLEWALCAFTEGGVLRYFARPKTGDLSMEEAMAVLEGLKEQPGYCYQPLTADWDTLTKPFSRRLHGHNQVTDAFLLGLAVREGLRLTTFDKGILHLAGEYREHVLVLEAG